jgi:YHS domain-containing protein
MAIRQLFTSLFLTLMVATNAIALDAIFTPWNNNLAIRGYDPVAYFTEDAAVEGSKQFEYEWQNATWRFSSEENLNMFSSNPETYAPQYGGYCAWAVAHGETASIEPEQFSIIDGKLYLNYNAKIQEKWKADTSKYIEQADENWPKLLAN